MATMVGLFGFANTGVHDVSRVLGNKTDFKVAFFSDTETPIPKGVEVVLAANAGYLQLITEYMEDHDTDYVLVLFDVPVRLDGIKDIVMVDVQEKKKSFYYDFCKPSYPKFARLITGALEKGAEFKLNLRRPNVIPTLLKSTASSILQRLQSWKYAIHPVEVRDEAMALLLDWFIRPDISVKQVSSDIEDLLGKEGVCDVLFKDDRYLTLKDAVVVCLKARLEKQSIVPEVAKEKGLSAFDIRYIMNAATTTLIYEDTDLAEIYKGLRKQHTAATEQRKQEKKNAKLSNS